MSKIKPDFGGYVTKYNVKCTDGRTILPKAFEEMHGLTVPLVWQHMHDSVSNVLGHGLLEGREDGVYLYGFFNDSDHGQNAKKLVEHKDISALSVYANSLVEKAKRVAHGVIKEASLVLSGANPGAKIDYIAFQHDDGIEMVSEDEAIIHSGAPLELPTNDVESEEMLDEAEIVIHADQTLGEVFATFNSDQKNAVYAMVAKLMEGGDMKQSALDEENEDEGETQTMKKNAFDDSNADDEKVIKHVSFEEVMKTAKKVGSLKEAVMIHAETYGIGSDRENLELLFPDARNATREPTWIARRMEWVSGVLSGTKHTPFSRIKSLHADITADEARARGYITGNLKVEEVFPILRRITTPTTIYKKQKLDRDDIIDITDFNVVSWLKSEMRVMLDEEIARSVLVGDGRDPVSDADNHINTDNIRPVWTDAEVYCHHEQIAATQDYDDMIDDVIRSRQEYRGSGNPTMFVAPGLLTEWLLLKDGDGRRLYRSVTELASEMRVKKIVEVPVMEDLSREDDEAATWNLLAIIVNLRDYTVGADKGGEINFFDDFDIDYNQYKYLLETRISGALTVPKSAIVLEQTPAA